MLYYKPNRDGVETFVINEYTGGWNTALSDHHRPSEGDLVGIHPEPDGRELDDFRRVMALLDLDYAWNDWDEEKGLDFYTIVKK